jgi:peptidoglycan/LPS O-acetylase OafA/YrhL
MRKQHVTAARRYANSAVTLRSSTQCQKSREHSVNKVQRQLSDTRECEFRHFCIAAQESSRPTRYVSHIWESGDLSMSRVRQMTGPARDRAFRYRSELDGLRAIAVLTVVVFHARGGAFPGGYIGVDVFFVLSGYLITSLLMSEHGRTGRISFRRFYARRALRLLPALLLVCAVVLAAWALVPSLPEHDETLRGVLTALTYTSSPVAASGASGLGVMIPTWSLSVEEYFYLLWPLLLLVLLVRAGPRLRIAVGSLVLVTIAYRWWGSFGAEWSIARISYGADTRAEQLLIGCGVAVVLPHTRRTVRAGLAVPAAGLMAVFVLWPGSQTHAAYLYGGSTVVALLVGLLIAHVVQHPSSTLGRALRVRAFTWVGRRSYGIYLWHVPLITLVAATPLGASAQLVVKLVLILAVPAASYKYLETPCLKLKRRLESGPALERHTGLARAGARA